jgi:hypothetical protein
MERIYLVAALAMIVTFGGFSHGFQSLQQLSLKHSLRGQAASGPQCNSLPSIVSRWVARVKSELDPSSPEEAQMLAEMNVPIAEMQAQAAEQAAKQAQIAAEIARQTAIREAERAQRDAAKMHEQMARAGHSIMVAPMTIDLRGLDNLDQRIQIRTAAIAEHIAARNMRREIEAAKWQAMAVQYQDSGKHKSPCPLQTEMR